MIKQEDFLGSTRYSDYVNVVHEAKSAQHSHWLGDEVPVSLSLAKFWNELKHKRPDIVMRFDIRASWYNGKGYRVYSDVGIAFKDAPDMSVGSIGIEMDPNDPKTILYVVKSDRIQNEKFAQYSEGYKSKKTKDFVKATKTAVQYLKPVVFEDLQKREYSVLSEAIGSIRQPANEKLYDAANMLQSVILDEIRNMVRTGYTPITPKFKHSVELLAMEDDELKQVSAYNPSACFVWAKANSIEYQRAGEDRKIVYDVNDVPQDIRDKVSVLQIGNKRSPIRDVGVKVSEQMYWVFL